MISYEKHFIIAEIAVLVFCTNTSSGNNETTTEMTKQYEEKATIQLSLKHERTFAKIEHKGYASNVNLSMFAKHLRQLHHDIFTNSATNTSPQIRAIIFLLMASAGFIKYPLQDGFLSDIRNAIVRH